MRAIVAGGGVAGLTAALVLARSGHAVTLVERDPLEASDAWESAMAWERPGIPHFHQPHAFLPRGRNLLRNILPDVYDALLAAGAEELDVARKAPGGARPDDADLVYLGVRRELIEWALRRAVLRERGIVVRAGSAITGLVVDGSTQRRVRGVRLGDTTVVGDIVVDAMGRRSRAGAWLAELGGASPAVESSETDLLYYSRFFQIHHGLRFPEGPWLLGPRGDLGYAAFTTFVGDNRTFAIALAVPTWDRELRALRHDGAFMTVCRAIPALAPLVDASLARPITPVLPMGSLQNTLRTYAPDGEPVVSGLFPVADAYCHTNPMFALGLSMALVHALALARALDESPDPRAQTISYLDATHAEAAERFRLARDTDDARSRMWRGERLDVARRTGSYPLFLLVAGGAVSTRDADVFHRIARRNGFLDRTSTVDDDQLLQKRIETQFAAMLADAPPAPPRPSRDDLLALVDSAIAPGSMITAIPS